MTDATLPAAVPLRLPPRSAYATPSSKSSKSTQRLKSSLTYYPIIPFSLLHICMKDLTAGIFHWSAFDFVAARCCDERWDVVAFIISSSILPLASCSCHGRFKLWFDLEIDPVV